MTARDYERWGNARHRHHAQRRTTLQTFLTRAVPAEVKPPAWDDISRWRGKVVWCSWKGIRRQVSVSGVAPADSTGGQRWMVQPIDRTGWMSMVSVRVSSLELHNPYALAVVSQAVPNKKRLTGRSLQTPKCIYL